MEDHGKTVTDELQKALDLSGTELISIFPGPFLMPMRRYPLAYELLLETSHHTVVLESFYLWKDYLGACVLRRVSWTKSLANVRGMLQSWDSSKESHL